MARRDEEDDEIVKGEPIKFGDPNYPTEQEAYDYVHRPETITEGNVTGMRKPASVDSSDDEVAKEIDDNDDAGEQLTQKSEPEEISDESEDLKVQLPTDNDISEDMAAAPGPQTAPPAQSYQDLMKQYMDLQQGRRKGDLVTALTAAGAKIGQSMAGKYSGQFNPDLSAMKYIQQIGERPTSDFEQGQIVQGRTMQLQSEMSANDPNSPQSKLVRQYLSTRLGIQLPDNVSASDAAMLMKTVGHPMQKGMQKGTGVATVEGQKQRVQASYDPMTGIWSMTKLGPNNQVTTVPLPDFQQESLSPYQYIRDAHGNIIPVSKSSADLGSLNKLIFSSAYAPVEPGAEETFKPDKTQQTALDKEQHRVDTIVKDVRAGLKAADELENAIKSGSKFSPSILKTSIPHMVGFNGRMSPMEQNMWAGSQSWMDRFNQMVSTGATGTLSAENKKQALALLDEYRTGVRQNLAGISKGSQDRLENIYSIPGKFTQKILQLPTAGEKRLVKKGYNPQTDQTILMYDDGSQEMVDGRR